MTDRKRRLRLVPTHKTSPAVSGSRKKIPGWKDPFAWGVTIVTLLLAAATLTTGWYGIQALMSDADGAMAAALGATMCTFVSGVMTGLGIYLLRFHLTNPVGPSDPAQ